jgi:hypothetical protein
VFARGIAFPYDDLQTAAISEVWRAEIVLFSADGVGTRDKAQLSRIPPLGSNITKCVLTLT